MGFLLLRGFYKSLAMTVLSEIGDKTFFAAAILAMRHPRRLVLTGCLGALIVMTIISVFLGWVAPNMISRQWIHNVATVLFFVFGLWSLWEGFTNEGLPGDLDEVEVKLNADFTITKAEAKTVSMGDDFKKQQRPFLAQFLSPIFLKAFSITFFGEWGDRSQIATIGLATDENPFGVVLGGIMKRSSTVYDCSCSWRKRFGISSIGESGCAFLWDSFPSFWHPIIAFIGLIILHSFPLFFQ